MSLAAQTLSASTASALSFMKDINYPGFGCIEGTVHFIKIIDRLFDILNSRLPFAKNYKAPLRLDNFHTIKNFLSLAESFLLSLKTPSGCQIVKSRSSTGFIGFIFCARSFLNLGLSLLSTAEDPHSYVLAYNFSQDRLELFFNSVRGSMGWNNSPSARQFRFIYRRYLAHAGVISDSSGNCVNFQNEMDDSQIPDVFEDLPTFNPNSRFVDNIVVYIAGYVVRKLLLYISCPDCRLTLIDEPKIASSTDYIFLRLKNNGGLISPSPYFVCVLKKTEQIYRSSNLKEQNHRFLTPKIINALMGHSFLNNSHFSQSDHLLPLLRSAIHIYCKIRCFHIAKQKNLSGTNFMRPRLTKQVHFLSQ